MSSSTPLPEKGNAIAIEASSSSSSSSETTKSSGFPSSRLFAAMGAVDQASGISPDLLALEYASTCSEKRQRRKKSKRKKREIKAFAQVKKKGGGLVLRDEEEENIETPPPPSKATPPIAPLADSVTLEHPKLPESGTNLDDAACTSFRS
ncbi:hypothetical protein JCGZ_11002 [Jatropha curcas]|uniref:Uncharacterized protein n=1 Tax=Jatropha curcas TaxID=180498 RepID=A0A067KJA1_JATCU|nr:hypothetical protein JCGZ_11002 [Jatropha curcas]